MEDTEKTYSAVIIEQKPSEDDQHNNNIFLTNKKSRDPELDEDLADTPGFK